MTELSINDGQVGGAGISRPVLEHAARVLGMQFSAHPDPERPDENFEGENMAIAVGSLCRGGTHDDCFFWLEPAGQDVQRALLLAVLDLHAHYLATSVDWSGVLPIILEQLQIGRVLRLRSDARRKQLVVRSFPPELSWWRRRRLRPTVVDCRSGEARILDPGAVQ